MLERARPEPAGVQPDGILAFLDSVNEKKINLHGFMLLKHGKVVAEGYYKPFNGKLLHRIFFVSKSITSSAIGILIGEGLVSLEDRVINFFPDKLPPDINKYTAMMNVKHLLTMTTGHPKSMDISVEDWVKSFLNTPPQYTPGTVFAYDTTGTHTLCAIIQKVTGMTVLDYLKPRLFELLGISRIEWESCPLGINKGGNGIKCTIEDLAKFGLLYLQKGIWKNERILPEGWVELSTANHINNSNSRTMLDGLHGYGYQFWRTRKNSYCAFGMGGQFIVVIPDKDAVFVSTANTLHATDGHQMILDSLWETIYPALKEEPLKSDPITYSEIEKRLDGLTLILPEGHAHSPTEERVSGKRFNFEKNHLNYGECEFIFEGNNSRLSFFRGNEKFDLCFGLNHWIISSDPFFGHESANAATWVDEKTCIIYIELFDTLQMFRLYCHFEDGSLVIQFQAIGTMDANTYEGFLTGFIVTVDHIGNPEGIASCSTFFS